MSDCDEQKIYEKYKREKKVVQIEVEKFYIDSVQVCCAWWGDGYHDRMMCRFYGARNLGAQPVCLAMGEDLRERHDKINKVPDFCILHD